MFDVDAVRLRVEKLVGTDINKSHYATVEVHTGTYKGHKCIFVTVAQMYEKPGMADGGLIGFLLTMRDTIGVKELDIVSELNDPGCETCDYGSKYGWEFAGWN